MRSISRPVLLFLILTALPVGAHAQPTPTRDITRVRDSPTRVVLTQALRLGSLDGRHDSFGRVTDAAFGAGGRIYVADDQNHRVAVFTAAGRFERFLGRRGKGPGEFESPWVLAVDARDTLFVWDVALARVSVFGPDLAYRRSFGVPAEWGVSGIDFLPDGRLLLSAYARGERGALHVLDRAGRRVRAFGPAYGSTPDLAGFEASLLGGSVHVDGGTIVYSQKSPYELTFFDIAGRRRLGCRGDPSWATRPAEVVVRSARGDGLEWNRYVHSTRVLSLGGGMFLNVVRDPVGDRGLLDVVTSDCRLLGRTILDTPLMITRRQGSRLLAVRSLDYPEVLVYRYEVRSRSLSSR